MLQLTKLIYIVQESLLKTSNTMSLSQKVLYVFQRSGFKVSHNHKEKQEAPPIFVCSCSTCVVLVAIRCTDKEDTEYAILHLESMMTMENIEATLEFLSNGEWHVTLLGGSNTSTHFNCKMNYDFVHDFVNALNETFTKKSDFSEESMILWREARASFILADEKDNMFVHTATGILDFLLAKKEDDNISSLKADSSFMNLGMGQHHKYVITPQIEKGMIGVKAFHTPHLGYDLNNPCNINMVIDQMWILRQHNLVKRLLLKDKEDAYFNYLKTASVQLYEDIPVHHDSENYKSKFVKASALLQKLISEETDDSLILTVIEQLEFLKSDEEEKVSYSDLKACAIEPKEIYMAC